MRDQDIEALSPHRWNIAIVDDDVSSCEAIQASLKSIGLLPTCFTDPRLFLESLAERAYVCLILDIHMPFMSGLEVQQRLHDLRIELPIIMVTGHGDVVTAVTAMKLGAVEFLQKPFPAETLLTAVQSILSREKVTDLEHRHYLKRLFNALTTRERDILLGIGRGLRSKQIADELGIAQKTVDEYRHRIFVKLNVNSATKLASLATEFRHLGLLN